MRLGEIKNIIDKAVNKSHEINFDYESMYDGRRFTINNYIATHHALKILVSQPWIEVDANNVKDILYKYPPSINKLEISPEEFNIFNSLISQINEKLPIFYGILETQVNKQDPCTLNIKLPVTNIVNLEALTEFNENLEEVFKLIIKHKGLNADIQFKGFDIGTYWYEFLIITGTMGAPIAYATLMQILKIIEKLIKLREQWYQSENTKYDALLRKKALENKNKEIELKDVAEKEIKNYIDSRFEAMLREEINIFINQLPDIKNSKSEMNNSIFKGVEKLIKLMEKGTEFHPSLNPPEYIIDDNQEAETFNIDYDKLKQALSKPEEEAKQIENNIDEEPGAISED